MPRFEITAPDGKKFEVNAPDGATQEQALSYFQSNYKPEAQQPQQRQEPNTTIQGLAGSITRGLAPYAAAAGTGAALGSVVPGVGTALGAIGGATSLALTDLALPAINAALGENYPSASQATDVLLDKVGVARPQTQAERIVQSATGAAGSASGFIKGGELLAQSACPLLKRVGNVLTDQPLAQYVGSAGAGAAGQYASEQGAGAAGQVGASLAGGTVAGLTPSALRAALYGAPKASLVAAPASPRQQAAQSVVDQAEKINVPIYTGDIFPAQTGIGKSLENITNRSKQQEARVNATKNFVNEFVPDAAENKDLYSAIIENVNTRNKEKVLTYSSKKDTVLSKKDYNTDPIVFEQQKKLSENISKYRKDVAKLEDELSGGQSRGYTDLLQEELDPAYQASLQGVNIDNFEEFKYLLDGANQKMPSIKQPTTLLTRIRQLGGIKNTDYNKSDIKAMDINVRGKTKRSISSEGTLQVTNKPKSLDYMREALVEEGWLQPNATINDLLDAMNVDEMARNTGIGHIYSPKDASKGLEYENSLQYVSGASEARDKLYFDYGIEDPKAFKENLDKGIAKAEKQLEKLGTQKSFDPTMDPNTLNANLLKKREQLNASLKQMEVLKSKEKSVPVPRVTQKIDELLAQWEPLAQRGDGSAQKLVSELNQQKKVFSRNTGINFLESKRKLLSTEYKKDASADDLANQLYEPLREDMGDFLKNSNPNDYFQWKNANRSLELLGKEARGTSIARLINKGDVTPEVAKTAILGNNPSDLRRIKQALSPEGLRNAKSIVMQDIFDKSKVDAPDGISVNPDKFLTQATKRATQFKELFSKSERESLEGLSRVLSITKQAAKQPAFVRNIPALVGGLTGSIAYTLGLSPTVVGSLGAGVWAGNKVYQSSLVRNAKISRLSADLSRTTRGSKREEAVMRQIMNVLRAENAKVESPNQESR